MDRNTVIGFILIGVLMMGMFYFNSKNRQEWEASQKKYNDSIAALKPKVDSNALVLDSLKKDSLQAVAAMPGGLGNPASPEQVVDMENSVMKVSFSTKGAQPKKVVLKNYKKWDGQPLVLQDGNFNKISYQLNAGVNQTAESAKLNFTPKPIVKNADGSQTLVFSVGDSTGKVIEHSYKMLPNDFMMDMSININGAQNMFTGNVLNLEWQTQTPQLEKDHKFELLNTHIGYKEGGEYDFKNAGNHGESDSKNLKDEVNWLGVRQQFFVSAIEAKNKFNNATLNWMAAADTSSHLVNTTALAKLNVTGGNNVSIPLRLYYGPSDYNVLKKYGNDMEEIVSYGSGIFSFVKYINRHILLPVFDFLKNNVASMGIVILLLTLFIRLITSPILYNSYLSGAKMKVLKPEVDELKAKFTNAKTGELDQQAFSMEQMKLWRSAGVNPMQGCIPALLQIPIFMSLYYFFQGNIDLRGKSFLWAQDLAAYDSILHLPFNIPFYGDHVSLFTITATITSFLISYFSMSQMQDQSNPVMKYMPYIFTFMLLFIFNSLPSALTWYYTVSNLITLILQFVIQKYIINHDKILVKINENKKKPVKTSKLQERIQAMQEQQRKLQEMKDKAPKK